jgi:hypothetical protein
MSMRAASRRRDAEIYLSKMSIAVSGKMRLWTRLKIFTLTLPEHDSGDSWKDYNDEGEEGEEGEEENGEEEEEVNLRGCIPCVRP